MFPSIFSNNSHVQRETLFTRNWRPITGALTLIAAAGVIYMAMCLSPKYAAFMMHKQVVWISLAAGGGGLLIGGILNRLHHRSISPKKAEDFDPTLCCCFFVRSLKRLSRWAWRHKKGVALTVALLALIAAAPFILKAAGVAHKTLALLNSSAPTWTAFAAGGGGLMAGYTFTALVSQSPHRRDTLSRTTTPTSSPSSSGRNSPELIYQGF